MDTKQRDQATVGRHRLGKRIGDSDAGDLYAATETWSGRDVVVEIATGLDDQAARERFIRDGMLAQRLEGEHVLRVLEVGTMPDGSPFVVREAAISCMADEIRMHGPTQADVAIGWTLEICEAIAEAHALGMSHGDVRPENVFLARGAGGDVIAKLRWTSTAKAEGRAKEDVHRDIVGLADLLRALVSGQIDLREEDRARTLPTPLAHVIAKAMASRAGDHFETVSELAHELAPFAPKGHPSARNIDSILARGGAAGAATANGPTSTTRPRVDRFSDEWYAPDSRPSRLSTDTARPRRHRLGTFVTVGLGMAAAIALAAGYLWSAGRFPGSGGTAEEERTDTTSLTSAEMTSDPDAPDLALAESKDGIDSRSAAIAAADLEALGYVVPGPKPVVNPADENSPDETPTPSPSTSTSDDGTTTTTSSTSTTATPSPPTTSTPTEPILSPPVPEPAPPVAPTTPDTQQQP